MRQPGPAASTLAAMAKQDELITRDPWAWQPAEQVMVLVSKRIRNVQFPRALLDKDATPEQMARWLSRESTASERNEATLNILAGVTFLAAWTSAWAYREAAGVSQVPKGAPREQDMVLVTPPATSTLSGRDWKDRESGRPNPVVQHAAWRRVVAYLKARGEALREAGDFDMWTADDGAEGPEVMLLPLADMLNRKTDAGRQAEAATLAAIPWCRESAHLGALHDYAARSPGSWNIATACRARALHFSPTKL